MLEVESQPQTAAAEEMVVACPLCQTNLDAYQGEHAAQGSQKEPLPIVYFTELVGLAFGLSPEALGLSKHFRDPMPALLSHSLVS